MGSAIESPAKSSSMKDAQNALGLTSSEAVLDIYRSIGTGVRVLCDCSFDPKKSEALQEKVSCARKHFLSHRGLWQHPRDFSCPDHR
jgi:hypothetical protein